MNAFARYSASGKPVQVKWLSRALQNLDDEAAFVARDDPAAARALAQRIHEAIGHLKANPALGRPGRIHGTRELVVSGTRYIVLYRVNPRSNRVEILRVFHTSRRTPDRW